MAFLSSELQKSSEDSTDIRGDINWGSSVGQGVGMYYYLGFITGKVRGCSELDCVPQKDMSKS